MNAVLSISIYHLGGMHVHVPSHTHTLTKVPCNYIVTQLWGNWVNFVVGHMYILNLTAQCSR